MKKELSILIPVFNHDCTALVDGLVRQASALVEVGVQVEIIIAEDGSTDTEVLRSNSVLASRPYCRYIVRSENVGRSAIRNYLTREARYEWLLFQDCDMTVVSDQFLSRYVESDEGDVVYGGYVVGQGEKSCLRYLYEKACESQHTATERRKRPFQHFHTSNFLVRRSVMTAHPFDERFRYYGYEDVFFGKQLRQAGITIAHADNPAGFCTFEDNPHFVSKTEEGLRTLYEFRRDLMGYSQMLTFVDGIHLGIVRWMIRTWHRLFGGLERRWLCGRHPNLRIFKLYKLGYYLQLENLKS